ncbi:hypothetical protein BXZ70DRAFT_441998 [Cristinia sonorae]|uniref:F-box domain-containing protein n=1 Tax=Cristinia sonorae TaxID=1940300 RepID=A0A8K0UIC2_9AGAR|nr:hypothetical protein BXZ70DRAFT_441998 [Cristinia sonorae]
MKCATQTVDLWPQVRPDTQPSSYTCEPYSLGTIVYVVETPPMPSPPLPQELIDVIIDCIAGDSTHQRDSYLYSCALVTDLWMHRCIFHLHNNFIVQGGITAQQTALLRHPTFLSQIRNLVFYKGQLDCNSNPSTGNIDTVLGVTSNITHLMLNCESASNPRLSPSQLRDGIILPTLTHLTLEHVAFDHFVNFALIIHHFQALESLRLVKTYQLTFHDTKIVSNGIRSPPRLRILGLDGTQDNFTYNFGHWLAQGKYGGCLIEKFVFDLGSFNPMVLILLKYLEMSLQTIEITIDPEHPALADNVFPWIGEGAWAAFDRSFAREDFACLKEVKIKVLGSQLVSDDQASEFFPQLVQRGVAVGVELGCVMKDMWIE